MTTFQYLKWKINNVKSGQEFQFAEFNVFNNGSRVDYSMSNASLLPTNGLFPFGDSSNVYGIDNNIETKVGAFTVNYDNIIYYINFEKLINATTYNYTTANDASNRDPISWVLYSSTDGVNYVILDTQNNVSITNVRLTQTQMFQIYTPQTLCFKEGSKILTNKGYVPVEQLRKGDLIKTYLHHYLPIVLIGKSTIYNSGDSVTSKNRLYTLPKSELSLLSEDLVLTGCHSLLVDGLYQGQIEDMAGSSGRLYKTDDKLRLFTCFEPKAIPYPEEGIFTIYHFALESDDDQINFGVWANGLLVETSSILCLRHYSNMEFIE